MRDRDDPGEADLPGGGILPESKEQAMEETKVIWGEEREPLPARVVSRDEKAGTFVAMVAMPKGEGYIGPYSFYASDEVR